MSDLTALDRDTTTPEDAHNLEASADAAAADGGEFDETESRPSKRRGFPTITLISGLAVAGALGFYLLTAAGSAEGEPAAEEVAEAGDEEETEKEPVPVETTQAKGGSISSYISSTANLVPENQVQLLAEWEGRVAKLNVEEGDTVRKGAVLAELARQDGEIILSKAKVRAENSRLAKERSQRLLQQELISQETFDGAKLEHDLAQQELAEAEWRIEKTYIRSPFSGRVTERLLQLGQHVRPGDQLFSVADFDPLVARIYLPEEDVLDLEEGRSVNISLRAASEVEFQGKIRQISPVVDTATGTVKLTVEARQVPRQVRPGAFVRIDIVRQTVADAVLVPREAVVRELQRAFVFVAADGVAEKRTVELGMEEEGWLQAVSGVAAGDQIIVAGQGGLKDGAPVKMLTPEPTVELASK